MRLPESAISWRRICAAAVLALSMVVLPCDRAWPQNELGVGPDGAVVAPSAASELWKNWSDPGVVFWSQPPGPDYWAIDYRCRTFCSSNTSYEFGMPPEGTSPGWAPLSRLNFSLNSCWHGLQIAHETPKWGFQLEWLMAGQYIQGVLEDYDWAPPNPDGSFTDLGFAQEQWTEGQMLDLEYKYQLLERPLSLPVEVWPIVGFRWQRLDIMTYDAIQVKSDNEWLDPPYTMPGNVLTFNQQYYIGYAGAQLRGKLESTILPPIALTLQGDWGYTEAYNTDHHLLRDGDRYTMERTHGNCWHAALTVEALVSDRFSFGCQADHSKISTSGTHRMLNEPLDIDETWGNGVFVSSHQTWITAFVRIRM